jgi:peroxin-12
VAQTAWNVASVAVHMLCLSGRLQSFTPDLWIAGLQLGRLDRTDYDVQTSARKQVLASRQQVRAAAGPLRALLLLATHYLRDAVRFALPISIFFLSFLQWWHASGHAAAANATPVVPSPLPSEPSPDGIPMVEDPTICPLCRDPRTNPAALAASGLLFCYPCVFKYVERHRRCPVTHLPATIDMLIRIHD